MNSLASALLASAAGDELCAALVPVVCRPTGISRSGHPFLVREAWEEFRDHIPHILGAGLWVHGALDRLAAVVELVEGEEDERRSVLHGIEVCRQVVNTAAITAPPDLWLLRHVLGYLADLGLTRRLLAGEAIYPDNCCVHGQPLHEAELDKDLHFLLSRGMVEQYDTGFRIAGHPGVRRLLRDLEPIDPSVPAGVSGWWRALFSEQPLSTDQLEVLLELTRGVRNRRYVPQNHWIPDLEDVELGYRLVPLVLGLRAANRCGDLRLNVRVRPEHFSATHVACAAGALEVLVAAGWMRRAQGEYEVTVVGARGFARGPGPFGIIETYHPYMASGRAILEQGPGNVWVQRGENVGASQDANRAMFTRANDALDRFCRATGFTFDVFIEHAIGRGEATRQRFERAGDATIRYVGADLEDAAIDAAKEEQKSGRLPAAMLFVRHADIGRPDILTDALRAHALDPMGAVMLVGNGFHEVRDQTDQKMVEVFRAYHDAGILLLFTEENALSIDDLRATAWNTYHAGFKYVHEKSGQGLRPASPQPTPRLGHPLRAAWSACAESAGYVRAAAFCDKTRTIYPYTRPNGHNPSISVNHFFVPSGLAQRLGISE